MGTVDYTHQASAQCESREYNSVISNTLLQLAKNKVLCDLNYLFVDYGLEALMLAFMQSPCLVLAITILFFKAEVTRESGAEHNQMLNKTMFDNQMVTFTFHELKYTVKEVKF